MVDKKTNIDAILSPNMLPQLAAFVSVVSAGGFTAASRRSGVDKTLLSRRVRALEAALQVQLLHRTTRRLHVTEAGRALFDRVSAPLDDVADGLARANRSDRVAGVVRVATLPALGACLWGPVLDELMQDHPELRVEIRATETMVNLVEQGFDLAIRVGSMPDSSLIARRLCRWRYVLVASPRWVDAHPELEGPGDLLEHWLLYDDVPNASRWRFERGDEGVEVEVQSRLATDNSEILLGAVLAGLGVSAGAPFQVAEYLRRGELVRLLPEWRVVHQHGVFAVTPHRSYTPGRVEVVRDTVARHLARLEAQWRELSE